MSALTEPTGGDQNRATELNAFAWTWFGVSTAIVAPRLYSRLKLTRNFWYDDFFIVLTWALTLSFSILWTILGQLGGCRHLYYLEKDPAQAIKASRINWISQPPAVFALVSGKISVAFLIMRIIGRSKWRKAFLIYVAIIGSVVTSGIAIVLTFAQCRPVTALWNPELVALGRATCWRPHRESNYQIFNGSWLAFIDLALALLPITVVWNLQMSLKKKCGVSAVMGLGVFACICACIKTSKLPELSARGDITYITVTLWIWNANECNIVIIAACIPTLRPLFLVLFKRPGWEIYRRRKLSGPSSGSHERPKWIDRNFGPASESTTAIGRADNEGDWIELGPDEHTPRNNGDIRQTFEFDVTSHQNRSGL